MSDARAPTNPPTSPSPADWQRVEAIFHQVADQPAGDQTRMVVQLTGEDVWLREQVLELSRADRHATSDSLLHIEHATSSLRDAIERDPKAFSPPATIGPYTIISRIAQGGFGVVYRASQTTPFEREVALKVIRPGFDLAQVLARFEVERHTLARLTHPNIARILDAGQTDDFRPYFAMEFVAGSPITRYCDEHRLAIRERLALFVQVCRAIHHAHQRAVVHRDIKPNNVLVTTQDGVPLAKVIDFGIAKLLDRSFDTSITQSTPNATLGTPEYMSPEQAVSAGGDIDVRSDVYSLGVLLHELMTGVLPHDHAKLREFGPAHVYQTIAQVDPQSPTRRIRDVGERAETIAKSRALPHARALVEHVRGDLATIIQKATAREQPLR